MGYCREQTFDELLSDPIAKLLYTSDGLSEDDVRDVVRTARHRVLAYRDGQAVGAMSGIGFDSASSTVATSPSPIQVTE